MTREEAWDAYQKAKESERETFAAWSKASRTAVHAYEIWRATAPEVQQMNPGDEAVVNGADW